ncbi:hypothetical protein SAMN02744133_104199 [Thalassospira xiamenensis M-5 = DSM 17429]|uniref:Uncharacterized protein n=1 Tax=Thalassospira xiamenensis M-5 = DSM 17429 TaxID=1123366 RepID=A0AB72UC81_9PROT|nr:hypothetical protein [Thalassospira xiamenensis]AJD51764.1 hypothetical protein TH3_08230 [Thalassospira xiamenensis M-5 = DSM 17429]SIT00843.1 hypothetical protein SAMN02744133_104199 [Thalassospira xiamenensis M-5 = DSM 17429]
MIRESIESAYYAYEEAYQIPIYGMFPHEIAPEEPLKVPGYQLQRSSMPFHLEHPSGAAKYECYVFDIELHVFPQNWRDFACSIFDEFCALGSRFSWMTFDQGFDFNLLFSEYFSRNVFAFCFSGKEAVFAESMDQLRTKSWEKRIMAIKERLVV